MRGGAVTRVVRIIDRLNVGGPAKHVVWLTAGLAPRTHRTVLVTGHIAPGEGDMGWFADRHGVEPVVVPGMSRAIAPRDAVVALRILRLLLHHRPRIVHTHKAKAGTVGRVATLAYRWLTPTALRLRPRDCRIVHTYHGHIFHSYHGPLATRLFIAIERILARFATDVIVTLSESQRRDIVERYRIAPADKVRVVPLGIDLDELDGRPTGLRDALEVPPDGTLIGTVGRLCDVKDQATFLEAAACLRRDTPTARFVVVGDGERRRPLEELARRLELRGVLTFLGFRDDVPRLYPDLDVVALTSLNEGTPVTLLEAMGSRRAVVATDVGGVADIMGRRRGVEDGVAVWDHGLTVPSRDPVAFARALRLLIERPALRHEMGARGRTFVESRMSTARLVSDVEKLYRHLGFRNGDTGVSAGHQAVGEGAEDEGSDHRRSRVHRLASG